MARNIEIKARVNRVDELHKRVALLADSCTLDQPQDDTFFPCAQGRLTLRRFADGRGELIHYRRADDTGPKLSFHEITPVLDADRLHRTLSAALGELGRVRKLRRVYLVGRTRVHVDQVEGLGDFMELEVVLAENEKELVGTQEAHALMAALGIAPQALVAGAYLDLLQAAGGHCTAEIVKT